MKVRREPQVLQRRQFFKLVILTRKDLLQDMLYFVLNGMMIKSQNILFSEAIGFVDHQGLRIGSIFYDLASLLFDPYIELPEARIHTLFLLYCNKHPRIHDPESAWPQFLDAATQRVMQANGAYGFLTRHKNLPHYQQWQAPGWAQLQLVLRLQSHAILPSATP